MTKRKQWAKQWAKQWGTQDELRFIRRLKDKPKRYILNYIKLIPQRNGDKRIDMRKVLGQLPLTNRAKICYTLINNQE